MTPILTGISSKAEGCAHAGLSLPPAPKMPTSFDPVEPDKIQTSFYNEEGFRCATWSPSGLSPSLRLYANITDLIQEHAIESDQAAKYPLHHTLYASWSKQLSVDALNSKFALLALSNKHGDVCIWTYSLNNGIQYATAISPHKSFVNLLDWTGWKKLQDTTYIAFIASSSTNGTVALSSVKVQFGIDSQHNLHIENVQAQNVYTWFEDNAAIPTLLKIHDSWDKDTPNISIAVSKGLYVYMLSLGIMKDESVSVQGDWMSYNLSHSGVGLSGGLWINENEFRGYTFEGEGCHVRIKDGNIEEDRLETYKLNQKLIQKYKQQWMEEQVRIEDDDLLGASDAKPCLWGASDGLNHIITAIYCTLESAEDSTIAFVLQKERGVDIESVCQDLDKYVFNPDFFFTCPVRGIIREILEYLVNEDNLNNFKIWLSKLTGYISHEPTSNGYDLTRALFSAPSIIAALIINNAEIELKHHDLVTMNSEFQDACKQAKLAIHLNYLCNVLDFALRLPDKDFCCLGEQDVMELLLLSDHALAIQNENAIKTALKIYTKLQANFPALDLSEEIEYTHSFGSQSTGNYTPRPREKCPVCDELVSNINNTSLAQCNAGHFWELCSITKRVLSDPKMHIQYVFPEGM
ncbi:hypothetical protein RO3G_09384 [Rhizopus delemar RA 99-880]|uniref:Uncharacterized protein n=1 Tax=Rhizopus delemar (strain RA 99-880 / ATCC MYA-4621 / FGSC 9543 / NRRL 43880) TaxID=246409 RepID=I1C894_RHIO9|nr:hypothetical protein RO3G_09384 [Rhizopus delemar RA 99-880]|eukprot:EIE84674.1 hypothetical protein RO3G_09384 [Rhizopus delemar RA 99-880]